MAARRKRRQVAWFGCPNCGADVRTDALACPECGSDAETGWSEETLYDGLDLPADDGGVERPLRSGPSPAVRVIAILLLVMFALALIL